VLGQRDAVIVSARTGGNNFLAAQLLYLVSACANILRALRASKALLARCKANVVPRFDRVLLSALASEARLRGDTVGAWADFLARFKSVLLREAFHCGAEELEALGLCLRAETAGLPIEVLAWTWAGLVVVALEDVINCACCGRFCGRSNGLVLARRHLPFVDHFNALLRLVR